MADNASMEAAAAAAATRAPVRPEAVAETRARVGLLLVRTREQAADRLQEALGQQENVDLRLGEILVARGRIAS